MKEFYPTPPEVVAKMIEGINLSCRVVLDPSAGKGHILDQVKYKVGMGDRAQIMAIEIEPEFRAILENKGYRIVGEDFLRFDTPLFTDLILMNPPFSNGEAHILRAWELLASGGDLVAVMNADSMENETKRFGTVLNKVIAKHGNAEDIGSAFAKSERRTKVRACIIRLKKPDAEKRFFSGGFEQQKFDREENSQQLVSSDRVDSMVATYQALMRGIPEFIRLKKEISGLISTFTSGHNQKHELEKILFDKSTTTNDKIAAAQHFAKKVAWHTALGETKFEKFTTSKVTEELIAELEKYGVMEFNHSNIMNLYEGMLRNRDKITLDCVERAFDILTRYDKKNTVHFEGWKTNSAFKVKEKCIIPAMGYYYHKEFADIEKALCLLTGLDYGDVPRYFRLEGISSMRDHYGTDRYSKEFQKSHPEEAETLAFCVNKLRETPATKDGRVNRDWVDTIETLRKNLKPYRAEEFLKVNIFPHAGELSPFHPFWDFRCYKKGTIHIFWKDKKLLEVFNYTAARAKKWLAE